MATMANPSVSNSPSPNSSSTAGGGSGGDGGLNSPSSRQRLQSPWAQVVRGRVEVESSSTAAAAPPISGPDSEKPEKPENNAEVGSSVAVAEAESNVGSKKPGVWRKPLNGVVEGTSVMGGAISWPALGESTRSTGKSSPHVDSSVSTTKPVLDGSTAVSQGPIIAQTPQKPANTNSNHANANANHNQSHGFPRQRSMKNHQNRGGASGAASQSGFSRPMPSPPTPPPMPPPPPFPSNVGHFRNFAPPPLPVLDPNVRGARPEGHSTHPRNNSKRNNNFGNRPRGDGQYHGGRRDHERHVAPQFVPPPPGSYMPPPPSPGSAPFLSPPPMRPFVPPMGFDMPPPPYMYAIPPYMAPPPPPPMYYPMMDHPLQALIIKQIDYYFSDTNLVKDDYLRSNMDDEGWVPLELISNFPRVQQLTTDVPLILESLKGSMMVEVKERGDKLRRRNDWRKWVHTGSSNAKSSGKSTEDTLSNSINKISLNEGTSSGSGDGNGASDTKDPEPEPEPARSSPSPAASSVLANGDASPQELDANSS